MPVLKNDRLLRALRKEYVDTTPIWIMRQAGRYLPEYREVRAKAKNFMTLCKTPELACEVTLQPLARFDLDAAIIFSDILTIPDAMGLGLYFENNEGPRLTKPLRNMHDIKALGIPDMETDLGYVMDAIRLVNHELAGKVPLIGFAGSPWTLATYMIEGSSSKNFQMIKQMLFTDSLPVHQLLSLLAETVSQYLLAQINAGVHVVMLFDTWGGILSTQDYQEFSLQYLSYIVQKLKKDQAHIPIILFTKNGGQWLTDMVKTGCDAIGVDWTLDLKEARARVGDKVTLQGNMDPAVLYGTAEKIREYTERVLESYGYGHAHVFNLGHGIHPNVPSENVQVLVNAVHELGKKYKK